MEQYIGKKIKGFKFKSTLNCTYFEFMNANIDKIGIIKSYNEGRETFHISFNDKYYQYPANLIDQHIIIEIPEMPIGILCWVWDGKMKNPKIDKRYVIGKKDNMYFAWKNAHNEDQVNKTCEFTAWGNAEPVVAKVITKEKANELLNTLTNEIYKIK